MPCCCATDELHERLASLMTGSHSRGSVVAWAYVALVVFSASAPNHGHSE